MTQTRRYLPFFAYLGTQLFAVAGLVTREYPDSPTYTVLSFLGHAPQMPTVPIFYTIFPNDSLRVVAQSIAAAICWWFLASVATTLIDHRITRICTKFVILALGLVAPVVSWNTTILSESLTTSLTAAMVAAWLKFVTSRSKSWALTALALTTAWTLTRQADVYVGLMITAVAICAAVGKRRTALKVATALSLVIISGYSLAIVNRDTHVSNGNIGDIIADRILLNSGYTDWFIRHGMPYSPAIAATANSPYGSALYNMPSFSPWLTTNGMRVYIEFMLSHPRYTLIGPMSSFFGEVSSLTIPNTTIYPIMVQPNPAAAMLSPTIDYGRYREVIPPLVTGILFEQGQTGIDLVAIVVAGFLLLESRRRRGSDRRQWIPVLLFLSVIPQGYFVWLATGVGELDRQSMLMAVSLRIALILSIAFSVDHLQTKPEIDSSPRTTLT